jgi:hypothetical protein
MGLKWNEGCTEFLEKNGGTMSVADMASHLGVTPPTVRAHLYEAGIWVKRPHNRVSWSAEDVALMRELHSDGVDRTELPKHFPNRTERSVSVMASRLGLIGETQKKSLAMDHDFFRNPTAQSSYWAGFIAADGCITRDGKAVTVKISQNDQHHLELLAQKVNFMGKIRSGASDARIINGVYTEPSPYTQMTVSSKNWVRDLQFNFSVTPRKSLTLKPPNIAVLDHKLAFLAGYIDGNGSISAQTTKDRNYTTLTVYGTREVVDWAKASLGEFYTPQGVTLRSSVRHQGSGLKMWLYSISGKNLTLLKRHIQGMGIPTMSRKWDKIPDLPTEGL